MSTMRCEFCGLSPNCSGDYDYDLDGCPNCSAPPPIGWESSVWDDGWSWERSYEQKSLELDQEMREREKGWQRQQQQQRQQQVASVSEYIASIVKMFGPGAAKEALGLDPDVHELCGCLRKDKPRGAGKLPSQPDGSQMPRGRLTALEQKLAAIKG